MATKFSELDDKLEKLAKKIEKEPQDLTLFAAKQAEEILKSRIFSDTGAKDVNGSLLPKYSKGYAKKAKKVSRTWDLQATGDLMRSIRPVNVGKNAALIFDNNDEIEKADDLQKRTGKIIFQLSEKEANEVIKRTAEQGIRELKKAIKEIFR